MRCTTSALALALVLAASASACYAPDVVSGSLRCGTGSSCPSGYSCNADDKTCWKEGEKPSTAPLGGDATTFIGHWLYSMVATNETTCTDGSRDSRTLENDYVDVAKGVSGDLTASYYCDWELNVAKNGETATLVPGTTCMSAVNDATSGMVKTKYTWSGTSFTFVKTGAKAAVVNAEISANYTALLTCKTGMACVPCTTGCTGSCTVTISGPLTKTD